MEQKLTEEEIARVEKREALIYSLDVVRVALKYGWKVKLFQFDPYSLYLLDTLKDNDINPDAFFSFTELSIQESFFSAYDWAREVLRAGLEEFSLSTLAAIQDRCSKLDQSYQSYMTTRHNTDTSDVFTTEERKEFEVDCEAAIREIRELG